jgi:hypothetical protein
MDAYRAVLPCSCSARAREAVAYEIRRLNYRVLVRHP